MLIRRPSVSTLVKHLCCFSMRIANSTNKQKSGAANTVGSHKRKIPQEFIKLSCVLVNDVVNDLVREDIDILAYLA